MPLLGFILRKPSARRVRSRKVSQMFGMRCVHPNGDIIELTSIHTFAIGDIHGRADLLRGLLDEISERATGNGYAYRIVFLGDIIDRGPDSREAMNLVSSTLTQIDFVGDDGEAASAKVADGHASREDEAVQRAKEVMLQLTAYGTWWWQEHQFIRCRQ